MGISIDRALEVIGEDGLESGEGPWEEYLAAIQLGCEALKAVKQYRLNPHAHQVYRLEGEEVDKKSFPTYCPNCHRIDGQHDEGCPGA